VGQRHSVNYFNPLTPAVAITATKHPVRKTGLSRHL